jgi:hypothetical protein
MASIKNHQETPKTDISYNESPYIGNISDQLSISITETVKDPHQGTDVHIKDSTNIWSIFSQWNTRLDRYRATHDINGPSFSSSTPLERKNFPVSLPVKHIAALIQMCDFSLWADMLMCAANVATAAAILSNTAPKSMNNNTTSNNRIYQGSRILVDFFISIKKSEVRRPARSTNTRCY